MTNDPAHIHVVYKTHLDVGYTDFAGAVVDRYFNLFIPEALAVAKELRESERPQRFIWTMGSWLVWEYLERANSLGRKNMEEAIVAGDVNWTATPFTMHVELADPATLRYGLSLSRRLDERFGRRTVAAKITDVPGTTVAILPLLAEAGVECLFIGANGSNVPPDVPQFFRWRWHGDEVLCVYQNSYGGYLHPPGSPDALSLEFTYDNVGPLTRTAVIHSHMQLAHRFPDADIAASTLDAFSRTLAPLRETLPIVEQELGDTWISGAASDPLKVARFREVARIRDEKVAEGSLPAADADAVSASLLLVPEHTWGLDDMVHLSDYSTWTKEAFAQLRDSPHWRRHESSWAEQRDYVDRAAAILSQAGLADEVSTRLSELKPRPRTEEGEWRSLDTPILENDHAWLRFDKRGALVEVVEKSAAVTHDCRFGSLAYEVFDRDDYKRYFSQYILKEYRDVWWVDRELGKKGLSDLGAFSRRYEPETIAGWQGESGLRFELAFPEDAIRRFGCPELFRLEWRLAEGSAGEIELIVEWERKDASRVPEAIWVGFALGGVDSPWQLEKLEGVISSAEVVSGGARRLHAIRERVRAETKAQRAFELVSLDAPVVSVGRPALLDHDNKAPAADGGIHVNLLNTTWGTNFPTWYDDDARFRFRLGFGGRAEAEPGG